MTKFVENLGTYITRMGIKQTFICMKTGMNPKTMSRIMTGVQDISGREMECIAEALGKTIEFFLSDEFLAAVNQDSAEIDVACYAGQPSREQEYFVKNMIRLIENADEILGAKARYMNTEGE